MRQKNQSARFANDRYSRINSISFSPNSKTNKQIYKQSQLLNSPSKIQTFFFILLKKKPALVTAHKSLTPDMGLIAIMTRANDKKWLVITLHRVRKTAGFTTISFNEEEVEKFRRTPHRTHLILKPNITYSSHTRYSPGSDPSRSNRNIFHSRSYLPPRSTISRFFHPPSKHFSQKKTFSFKN